MEVVQSVKNLNWRLAGVLIVLHHVAYKSQFTFRLLTAFCNSSCLCSDNWGNSVRDIHMLRNSSSACNSNKCRSKSLSPVKTELGVMLRFCQTLPRVSWIPEHPSDVLLASLDPGCIQDYCAPGLVRRSHLFVHMKKAVNKLCYQVVSFPAWLCLISEGLRRVKRQSMSSSHGQEKGEEIPQEREIQNKGSDDQKCCPKTVCNKVKSSQQYDSRMLL